MVLVNKVLIRLPKLIKVFIRLSNRLNHSLANKVFIRLPKLVEVFIRLPLG